MLWSLKSLCMMANLCLLEVILTFLEVLGAVLYWIFWNCHLNIPANIVFDFRFFFFFFFAKVSAAFTVGSGIAIWILPPKVKIIFLYRLKLSCFFISIPFFLQMFVKAVRDIGDSESASLQAIERQIRNTFLVEVRKPMRCGRKYFFCMA